MAIAPIDLQTMYSQMSNVAKVVADRQQGTQLASQMQEINVVKQNEIKSQAVQKTADNEAKSNMIKGEGRGNSSYPQGQKHGNGQQEEESETPGRIEIRESYLGNHIDVSR